MKANTIKKTIAGKIEDWIKTLPEDIQKYVHNNVVVTGGCIASMFLKEPVNDYDIYFKNIKTVLMVTQHYCKKWIQDNESQKAAGHVVKPIQPVLRITYKEDIKDSNLEKIRNYFTHKDSQQFFDLWDQGTLIGKRSLIHPEDEGLQSLLESGWTDVQRVEVFIQSQGFIGDNPDEEYDYFETRDPDDAKDFIDKSLAVNEEGLNEKGEKYRIVFMSSNAITLSNKVQIVIRFFGEPSEIHDTYDFIHATNYWTKREGLVTNTVH